MSKLKSAAIALAGAAVCITLWQWLSEGPQPGISKVEVVKEIRHRAAGDTHPQRGPIQARLTSANSVDMAATGAADNKDK